MRGSSPRMTSYRPRTGYSAMARRPQTFNGFCPSLAGLGILHVEFAERAGNDEIIIVQHECARDAVLVELERHRIDRRLLAVFRLGLAIVIAHGDGPAGLRFHLLIAGRRIW